MADYSNFDVVSFLEDRDIEYKTSGKNVTEGWVEINCPFCGNDPSHHFGINLNSGFGNCWICGKKSNPVNLIQEIDSCSWQEARDTITEFTLDILDTKKPKKTDLNPTRIVWPKYMENDIPKLHKTYLEGRGFDSDMLTKEFGLKFTRNLGQWKFRIIIPVQFEGKIVTFTSRDVTGKAEIKYRHLPDREAVVPIKHTLYGYDRIRDTAVLVEGIMDVWNIGHGAIGSFGTMLTQEQKSLLTKIKNLFIMFDSDATDKAIELCTMLQRKKRHVEVVTLSEGDPAELPPDVVTSLRKELRL